MSRLDMWCSVYITHGGKRYVCHKKARHNGNHKTKGPDGDIEWSIDD